MGAASSVLSVQRRAFRGPEAEAWRKRWGTESREVEDEEQSEQELRADWFRFDVWSLCWI